MKESYQAYLLRLRRGPGSVQWRATLENARTGEVLRFGSEREMFRYLLGALATERAANEWHPFAGEDCQGGGAL